MFWVSFRDATFSLPIPLPQLWLSADNDISPILCFTLEQIIIILTYMEALFSQLILMKLIEYI